MNEDDKKIQDFIEDIIKVYKKHNLSLAHEDLYGGFVVQDYKEKNVEWIRQAYFDNTWGTIK